MNFAALLASADITVDGHRAEIKKTRRFRRHSVVTLSALSDTGQLTVESATWRLQSRINAPEPELFAGLNTALTISKNNDLQWIEDWAKFHVETHGLEAVALIDNGSDQYSADAILGALERAGLKVGLVALAPVSFGPTAKPGPYRHGSTFFQVAHLNAVRRRFLSHARAILQCDVDELVHSKGASIFDLAKKNPLGILRFPGTWRYIDQLSNVRPRHKDHRYTLPDASKCPHKYCINPRGFFGNAEFNLHHLESAPLSQLLSSKRAGFWHCASISTNWKIKERNKRFGNVLDTATARALDQAFSPKPPRE